ncbi:MAG: hypothetical protein KJI71_05205 [Patescibacteria group bacterium]|nr:hypothetical protein [Patescibacteria group bacterium]
MFKFLESYFSSRTYPKLCHDCDNLLFFHDFKEREKAGLRNYLKGKIITKRYKQYCSTRKLINEWHFIKFHRCVECHEKYSDFLDDLLETTDDHNYKEIKPIDFKKSPLKRYKINEYLSVRLYERFTYIYIKEERFFSCMRLLLNILPSKLRQTRKIQSIDEAEEVLSNLDYEIAPEMEFLGHCSNLQVWVENGYDTRLLHRNLAFPLLKELTKAGDPLAKKVFKEEVIKRLLSGYLPVIEFLIENNYVDLLTIEELSNIFEDRNSKLQKNIIFDLNYRRENGLSYFVLKGFATHGVIAANEWINRDMFNHLENQLFHVIHKLIRNFHLFDCFNKKILAKLLLEGDIKSLFLLLVQHNFDVLQIFSIKELDHLILKNQNLDFQSPLKIYILRKLKSYV